MVLGHSGTTGYDSDPDAPGTDVLANSWAVGTNPAVQSLYLRVLALNPAVEGHAVGFGIDGSDVDSLIDQELQAAAVRPRPDLVLIQSIDNDIKCDGTDDQNYERFRQQLTTVMDALARDLPDARVFFVDQWSSVKTYDRVALQVNPDKLKGSGPCDVADTRTGKVLPAKEAYLQGLVDRYFAIIGDVCGLYPRCRTDGGALQGLRLTPPDLSPDMNHLSVSGHRKMAALVFEVLYGKRAGR
ncbi:hypothetical protein GCM10027446_01770 [Angustibacter peucedani]